MSCMFSQGQKDGKIKEPKESKSDQIQGLLCILNHLVITQIRLNRITRQMV